MSAASEVKSWDLIRQVGKPGLPLGSLLQIPWVTSVSTSIGSLVLLDILSRFTRGAAPSLFRWLCIWSGEAVDFCAVGNGDHGPALSLQGNNLPCKVEKIKPRPWCCWDFPGWKLSIVWKGEADCPRPARPVLFMDGRVPHQFIDETLLGLLLRDRVTINE